MKGKKKKKQFWTETMSNHHIHMPLKEKEDAETNQMMLRNHDNNHRV
jgi:hypothetical protein